MAAGEEDAEDTIVSDPEAKDVLGAALLAQGLDLAPDPAARSALVNPAIDLSAPPPGPDSPLGRFLAERSIVRSLQLWFGDGHAALQPPYDRQAILRALDRDIAEIDELLNEQLNAILHHPRFQKLESAWCGIRYLVTESDGLEQVKIRLMQLTWAELCRDQERAIEFDQSQLFQKVYSDEFGMPGGEPFGVLIGDYEVQHRRTAEHPTDDVAALGGMAQVAAAAFAPFIVGCRPELFGLEHFRELSQPIDLVSLFRQTEYARWIGLQDGHDLRFVGVTLPRILMRLPYPDDGSRQDHFRFREDLSDPTGAAYLWGCASFAFASVLIRSFAISGWFADIRGTPRDAIGGGIVTDLPNHEFGTDRPGVAVKSSTDVIISERQERDLSDLGFMPLAKAKDAPEGVFYSNQSLQRAQRFDAAIATANARLSAMLQYMLCVGRFAHYIKVIGRDRVGSFSTPEQCETYLRQWLAKYQTANDNASLEMKARLPLRELSVQVREQPGKPGTFFATINLKPHFQLDQVVSSFRLVTELAPAGGRG